MATYELEVQTVHSSTHTIEAENLEDAKQAAYEDHRSFDTDIVSTEILVVSEKAEVAA